MNYETINRPGYLGAKREETYQKWNQEYGQGNWRLVWKFEDKELDFLGACQEYENSYYEFLASNPSILDKLISIASDVYDDSPTNVNSKNDYTIQETDRTHIQDIAIRNSIHRLGQEFQGDKLIQIRWKKGEHPLSITLAPGEVPFYRQDLIILPWLEKSWWQPGSVECFYQSNKFLQVRK